MRMLIPAVTGFFAWTSNAAADMVRIESTHDVTTTIDRLDAAVQEAGAKVFA
jgi:uncharacterized protein (DUF302 family)